MVFARVEKWLLNRLPSRRAGGKTRLEATEDGLLFREDGWSILVGWQEIARVVAVRRDLYLGSTLSLLFETLDGRAFELSEENPAWSQVGPMLSRHLDGVESEARWILASVAAEDGIVDIYRR